MSDASGKAVVTVGKGDSVFDVVVSELTVAQMRQVIMSNPWPGEGASEEDLAHYQLENYLFEDCRLCDLSVMANLDKASLSGLTGSELRKILAKAKELNPDFFAAVGRMHAARKTS